jgi:quinol monooxygenase YgiN
VPDVTTGGYGLVVRFDVLAGHEEAFDALVSETVERIRAEESGTLVYLTHREDGAPSVRVFYELYRDVAAFEAHEGMPHVRRFLAERSAHLRGDPLVWRVTPVAGVVREGTGLGGG